MKDLTEPEITAIKLMLGWSDGFIRAFIKQKKDGVWMFTMALLNPTKDSTSPFHTYCLMPTRQ
jgi:hypothetical protein